jgi:tRNA(adenine34) deaminase
MQNMGAREKAVDEVDVLFMGEALKLAQHAATVGEVPVGAVAVFNHKIIGRGFNQREQQRNPFAHAEFLAMQEAARHLGAWRLSQVTVYVTLEPCSMCAGALVLARVSRLVFGASDAKAGAIQSLYALCSDARLNHRVEITAGVLAEQSGHLLSAFFKQLRLTRVAGE